jgi:WD40 repeat protein
LLSAKTGKLVRTVKSSANQNDLYLGFTPGGRLLLASGAKQLRLDLLDAAGTKSLFSATANAEARECPKCAAAGPKDRNVYVSARRSVVRWTPKTGAVETLFEQDAMVGGLAVSSDEQLLITLGGNSVPVWELPDSRRRLELKHPLAVSGAAFAPGGRLLTACYDGSVRLWDLEGGKPLRELDLGMGKIYCLAVAPDGLTCAVGVEKKNRIAVLDLPD